MGQERPRTLGRPELAYPDPQGMMRLREAVAAYLSVSRGVECSADQVIVTGGFQSAVGLVTRALLQPGCNCSTRHLYRALARAGCANELACMHEHGVRHTAGSGEFRIP